MKSIFYIFLLTCCVLIKSYASAESADGKLLQMILSVNKSAVTIQESGLILISKNGAIKIKTLRTDSDGHLYVLEKDICVDKGFPRNIYFECDTCHRIFRGSEEAKSHVKESGHKRFHMV